MADSSDEFYSFLRKNQLFPKAKSDVPISSADDSDSEDDSLHFDESGVGEQLRQASTEKLNEAPFGVIQLDDDGTVTFYNQYESDLSGVDPSEAIGKNFFTQLAPCSNNQRFQGRFRKGVKEGELDEHFTYTFTYKMRPTLVDVRLYRDAEGNNWVMIQKR